MTEPYRNVVFDLYGTLVDIRTDQNKPHLWTSFAWYLRLLGMNAAEDTLQATYLRLCRQEEDRMAKEGKDRGLEGPFEIDILRVWQGLGREYGRSLTRQEAEEVSLVFRSLSYHKLRLCPGVKELIRSLRDHGKKVYLLSNAQASFTMPELRLLGLADVFDAIFISSDAGVKKPSRDFFRLLLRAGIRPEESVMVGNDAECDCLGAAQAGMDSFYIHTEQSPERRTALPAGCREISALSDLMPQRFSCAFPVKTITDA